MEATTAASDSVLSLTTAHRNLTTTFTAINSSPYIMTFGNSGSPSVIEFIFTCKLHIYPLQPTTTYTSIIVSFNDERRYTA